MIAVGDATDAVVAISMADGSRAVIAPPSSTPVGRNSLVLDAGNNRLLVTEHDAGALAWIDLSTGARALISDATHGTGDTFVPTAAVLVPAMADRAFVLVDSSSSSSSMHVYSVELSTGNRTPLSAAAGVDMVYDQNRNRLVVVGNNGVQAVDLTNGNATTIATSSDTTPAVGRGSPLFNPAHSIVDGDRLLVAGGEDVGSGRVCIHAVDLGSGNHHDLAALTLGSDPLPLSSSDMGFPFTYDPATGRALVLDPAGRLLSVRLQPGDREYFSTLLYGNGPAFADPAAIADDPTRNRWLVADWALGAIGAVDKKTGDRSVLSDASTGTGPGFGSLVLAGVAVDTVNDTVIVRDQSKGVGCGPGVHVRVRQRNAVISRELPGVQHGGARVEVLALDTHTGQQTVVSDDSDNGGSLRWQVPIALELDPDAHRLLGLNLRFCLFSCTNFGPDSLLSIDLADGAQSVMSDATKGGGFTWQTPSDVVWDQAHNRALLAVGGLPGIAAVDPSSGDRAVFSGGPNGSGVAFSAPGAAALDVARNRCWCSIRTTWSLSISKAPTARRFPAAARAVDLPSSEPGRSCSTRSATELSSSMAVTPTTRLR